MSADVLSGGAGWFRVSSVHGPARVEVTPARTVVVRPDGAEFWFPTAALCNFWVAFTPDLRSRPAGALNTATFIVTGLLRGPTHLDDFTGRCTRVVVATGREERTIFDLGPMWARTPPRGLAHAMRATVATYGGQRQLRIMAEQGDAVVSDILESASPWKSVSRRRAYDRAMRRIRAAATE